MSNLPTSPRAVALLKGHTGQTHGRGLVGMHVPRNGVHVYACVFLVHKRVSMSLCACGVCMCVSLCACLHYLEVACGCTCMHACTHVRVSVPASRGKRPLSLFACFSLAVQGQRKGTWLVDVAYEFTSYPLTRIFLGCLLCASTMLDLTLQKDGSKSFLCAKIPFTICTATVVRVGNECFSKCIPGVCCSTKRINKMFSVAKHIWQTVREAELKVFNFHGFSGHHKC